MTATFKAVSAVLLAATISLALFLSPVGISSAQDDAEDPTEDSSTAPSDDAEDATTDDDARPGRGDRTPLTEEEQAARQAEREAARAEYAQALADELGVTVDALEAAFQTVAIDQVNARLAAGDITQERADEIIARIESGEGFAGPGSGGFGHGGHGRGGHGPDADTTDTTETEGI